MVGLRVWLRLKLCTMRACLLYEVCTLVAIPCATHVLLVRTLSSYKVEVVLGAYNKIQEVLEASTIKLSFFEI